MRSFIEYFMLMENDAKRSYSCLMLDCKDLADSVERIHNQIKEQDIHDEAGHGLEKEHHITVLYGIHTSDSDEVKNSVNLRPIVYKLTDLSLFENDEFDVLKCSVESDDLHELNEECCDSLEFTSNYPDYKPHMTIAYLKKGAGKKYLKIDSDLFNVERESNEYVFSDKDSNKTHWTV